MNSNKETILLDCTLRDGGYYNNWDFSLPIINKYLMVMSSLKMDYVEIGFRFNQKTKYIGQLGYSHTNFLSKLEIPNGLNLGVMFNAADYFKSSYINILDDITKDDHKSIKLIRIATHSKNAEITFLLAEYFKRKGYLVGINLMQASLMSEESIKSFVEEVSSVTPDVLYFADSLGSMDSNSIKSTYEAFRSSWAGDIGFHAHNNMNMAISNTLEFIRLGGKWVDSTVSGMGRGAGNAETEILFSLIKDKYTSLIELSGLLEDYFYPMKYKHKWGAGIFYALAAKNNIHPTFIQKLLQDSRYDEHDIVGLINYFKSKDSNSYQDKLLNEATKIYQGKTSGNWSPKKVMQNKTILIIGTGPSATNKKSEIEFISNKLDLISIGLNNTPDVDYNVIIHPIRILSIINNSSFSPKSLILPLSMLEEDLQTYFRKYNHFDFGAKIGGERFNYHDTSSEIPTKAVLGYALSIANSGCAKEIILAGFDGYKQKEKNDEMNNLIEMYFKNNSSIPLCSITPTKYNIDSRSVYDF